MGKNAACKESVLKGDQVDITKFPIPIWTPGKDGGPYITSPYVITKDPDTGIRNVGTYRMMIKGRNKTGITVSPVQHIGMHYAKYEERNESMPAAVVIGADPTIGMTSVAKLPYGTDELSVAGGLRGTPIKLVKCETVDLEVPETAEIVLEGVIPPEIREEEGPFGEFVGYLTPTLLHPIFDIKCITHRSNPIYQAFVSQKPPSESSKIKGIGIEALIYKHLVHDHQIPGVLDVHVTESSAVQGHVIIKIRKMYPGHARQVLHTCWTVTAYGGGSMLGKIISVMDDDIDIRDPFAVDWAYNFRVQPHRDITIIPRHGMRGLLHDFSMAPPASDEGITKQGLDSEFKGRQMESSKMLIDATKKWPYPEVALPSQEYLDRAKERWKAGEYGFPPL
jgi:UbiD family decarboxylase